MNASRRASRLVLTVVAALALAVLAFPVLAAAQDAVPAPVIVSPAPSTVVTSSFVITGRVGPLVTVVNVSGATTATVTILPADSEGATFTAEVTVGYGHRVLTLTAGDGVDVSDPVTLSVWQLGKAPAGARFVLVDKSDFMVYVVTAHRVVAAYPCAIGMRGTPTPTGTRYLGRPVHAPNSVWGPFRMRLYRRVLKNVAYHVTVNGHRVKRWHKVLKNVGTSYYIHGTNDPSSIGTPASHGCVRLWNSNLRIFRTLTVKYELTRIRA